MALSALQHTDELIGESDIDEVSIIYVIGVNQVSLMYFNMI